MVTQPFSLGDYFKPVQPAAPIFLANNQPAAGPGLSLESPASLGGLAFLGLGGFLLMEGKTGLWPMLMLALGGTMIAVPDFLESAVFAPLNPAPAPAPAPASNQGVVKYVNTADVMTPETAYKLVQQGQYDAVVKKAKVSVYFTWGNVFSPPSRATQKPQKSTPLSTYQNAAKLARAADKIRMLWGKPLYVYSWWRPGTSSFHKDGRALDFAGGGLQFADVKKGGPLFNAARRVREINGIGYPTSPGHVSLHVDIGHYPYDSRVTPGKQAIFIDNGSYGGGYEILNVAGGNNV